METRIDSHKLNELHESTVKRLTELQLKRLRPEPEKKHKRGLDKEIKILSRMVQAMSDLLVHQSESAEPQRVIII